MVPLWCTFAYVVFVLVFSNAGPEVICLEDYASTLTHTRAGGVFIGEVAGMCSEVGGT